MSHRHHVTPLRVGRDLPYLRHPEYDFTVVPDTLRETRRDVTATLRRQV
jgi:hypothetical protein